MVGRMGVWLMEICGGLVVIHPIAIMTPVITTMSAMVVGSWFCFECVMMGCRTGMRRLLASGW
jgi:hypothetical protein